MVMHHAIAVDKELCLGFVWGMFVVFFQISTVIIYEYTDIPAFKFFAALHPYNLSVMIRVEPLQGPALIAAAMMSNLPQKSSAPSG